MKILKKLENIFAAVAFAEEGEHETAREILRENDDTRIEGRKVVEVGRSGKHEHISHSPSKA